MGGLVARYYLEVLGGWEKCRALFTFGTPHRGSLNAALTVEAMLKAGVFVPVYGVGKSAPKYLVLINRSAPEDHLSRMEAEVVRHLGKNGVNVDHYYFDTDPRLCWKEGAGGAATPSPTWPPPTPTTTS
jgi:hypothetical protein